MSYMFVILLVASFFASSICGPYRQRRQDERQGQSDSDIMYRYWREQLPLGFFVNQGTSDTGDSSPSDIDPGSLMVRDKIASHKINTAGSGGGESRRDDIEKPTEGLMHDHQNNKIDLMEKIATEETGKLAAKIEKDGEKKSVANTTSTADTSTPAAEKKHEEPTETSTTSVVKSTGVETPADPGDHTKTRHSVTCQGLKEWLQCDGPYELIKIKNAFWGRDNDYTCAKSGITHGLRTDTNCAQDESNTMNKVREACDNENVCEVVASGIYFDKADCTNVYKYLALDWECAPSESRIKETIS